MRSRSKTWLLGGIALASAGALLAAAQPWVTLRLAEGAAAFDRLEVTGQQINPSLSSIAIAGLAAALVLTIAGPVFRRVLGVLVSLFGAGIAAIAIGSLNDPWAAAASRLAEITGIAGDAQLGLATSSESSPVVGWALVSGLVLVLLGALVVILGGRWRAAGRKYEGSGERPADGGAGGTDPDRISDWEAQNEGRDPSAG